MIKKLIKKYDLDSFEVVVVGVAMLAFAVEVGECYLSLFIK